MPEIKSQLSLSDHLQPFITVENETLLIIGAHQLDITNLSLDDLIIQFQEVDRQYHMLKARNPMSRVFK